MVDAGTYWLFLCGRTGGASEGFPALLFCHIPFISGKAAPLLSSPGPGRLTLPVSCWAVPFPRAAWPWQATFQFPPSQEGYEGLTPTESSWKVPALDGHAVGDGPARGPEAAAQAGHRQPQIHARDCVSLSLADICWQRHELFRDTSESLGVSSSLRST